MDQHAIALASRPQTMQTSSTAQPISTAPRDGRRLVLWIEYPAYIAEYEGSGEAVIGYWADGRWAFYSEFPGIPIAWAPVPSFTL